MQNPSVNKVSEIKFNGSFYGGFIKQNELHGIFHKPSMENKVINNEGVV